MNRISMLLVFGLGAVLACARGEEQAAQVLAGAADTASSIADVSSAPAPSKASGKHIGIALAANMYGELEPCG